jgi:hypothetical protein
VRPHHTHQMGQAHNSQSPRGSGQPPPVFKLGDFGLACSKNGNGPPQEGDARCAGMRACVRACVCLHQHAFARPCVHFA